MLMDDNPVSNGGKCGPLVGGSSTCSPTTRKVRLYSLCYCIISCSIVLRISKGVVNPAAYQYFLHVVTYKVQTYDVTYGVISATYQLSTSAVHLNVNIFAPPLVWMIDEPTRLP